MTTPQLHTLDASTLAIRLQRREITAEQVVRACLDHIGVREPAVRAWTCVAADAALATARELDRGPLRGPLHGLPIGVKDLFDTADLPTAYGSPIYDGYRPAADAAVVAVARQAGAIVLGKTVTTEFASFNPGKTCNPHQLGHTPGGSSSGSAAAVADCMVPLALGTQTAASIIRPAAFCGVVGFKPSYGRISRAGIKNLSETLDTVGVFGRSVADAALFAAVLCNDGRLQPADTEFSGASLRIGVCRTFEWAHADTDTTATFERGADRLARAGARVTAYELPTALSTMLAVQTEIMGYEMARNLASESIFSGQRLSAALTSVLAAGNAIGADRQHANLAAAADARRVIDTAFDAFDVLLAPSSIGVAPAGLEYTGDPVFSRTWTLLGNPCIHLPFDTGRLGLPIGLQAIGRFGSDARLLQAARWMHRQLMI